MASSSPTTGAAAPGGRRGKRCRSCGTRPDLTVRRRIDGGDVEASPERTETTSLLGLRFGDWFRPFKRRRRTAGLSSSSPPPPSSSPPGQSPDATESKMRLTRAAEDAGLPPPQSSALLRLVPTDVVVHTVSSYLHSPRDVASLSETCTLFRKMAGSREVLAGLSDIGGLISGDEDSVETAAEKLAKYVDAGNVEAIHMMGVLRCYCLDDVRGGVALLRKSSLHPHRSHLPSAYVLGIILRDCDPEESRRWMALSAAGGYLPALQERCTTMRELRAAAIWTGNFGMKYEDPTAEDLRYYLEPTVGLGKLLSRHYVLRSSELASRPASSRSLWGGGATSHCWNPLCGRWAYKSNGRRVGGRADLQSLPSTTSAAPFNDEQMGVVRIHSLRRQLSAVGLPEETEGGYARARSAFVSSTPPDLEPEQEPLKVARMKMCSSCRRAKYCSKLCQVYDWRSGRHKLECQYL